MYSTQTGSVLRNSLYMIGAKLSFLQKRPSLLVANRFFFRTRKIAPKGLNSELVSLKPHYFFMFLIIMSSYSKHMYVVISSSCTALPLGHLCSAKRKEKFGKEKEKLPHANIYTAI